MDCFSIFPFFSGFLYQFWMNLFWGLLLAIEMIFWHNLQIKITTETEDTLRTDSTLCGDMAIWEQETDVLYQVAVYADKGKMSRPLGQYVDFMPGRLG